jgi:hypothetical protein
MERCQVERCHREIATIEAALLAGNRDVEGLCLALADWWADLRIIEAEQRQKGPRDAEGSPQDREVGG